ncbi:MAG: aminotransferase class I/II-fold pyridoxal phosphate-dependent enzyme [Firmicutes bacterium]|nr:aminotransferase class I/II-fold pyridoxal phosphate-dependent enzyme [Bacillota bacterium]
MSNKERERTHGGNIRAAMGRYGLGEAGMRDSEILDFSANINPLGPPRSVLDAIIKNLPGIARYPDPECVELRREIARHLSISLANNAPPANAPPGHIPAGDAPASSALGSNALDEGPANGITPDNIIAGNGAVELVYLIAKAVKPGVAIVPCPAFSEYALAVRSEGGDIKRAYLRPDRGFNIDPGEIASALPGADILFICNPNNPTGNLWPREALLHIVGEAARAGAFVVIDEAFVDFVDDEKQVTVVDEAPRRENLIVLRSMTKIFAIPGLRLGYAVCSSEMAQRLASLRDPWSVNSLAQAAGIEALRDRDYIVQTKKLIRRERGFLYDGLAGLPGIEAYRPEANFILARIAACATRAGDLAAGLGRRGILIRDASSFDGLDEAYFRVAVRTRPENERLLEALGDCLMGAI